MKRTTRVVATVGVTVGLAIGGAGIAHASLSFGALSVSYNGKVQGAGYGTAFGYGSTAKLQSTLKDERVGDGRTYAKVSGYGKVPNFEIQSGRRTDGGRSYAEMAERSQTTKVSVSGYSARAQVCQDIPLKGDPCSSSAYGKF